MSRHEPVSSQHRLRDPLSRWNSSPARTDRPDAIFVDHTEIPYQPPNRLRSIRNHAERMDIAVGLSDGDHERFRMDIEADKSYLVHDHDRLLRIWLCVVQSFN